MRNQVNLTVFNLRKREISKKKYKIINGFFMTVVEIKTINLVFFTLRQSIMKENNQFFCQKCDYYSIPPDFVKK